MALLELIRSRGRINVRTVIALSALAAVSTTLVLMVVNTAASQVEQGQPSLRLLAIMAIAILAFAWSQTRANTLTAAETERLLHGLRERLFTAIRQASPEALDKIGQGKAQAALTTEMQSISGSLPIILIGIQQFVMLVFIGFYMIALSTLAFAMISVFSLAAVFIHINRLRAVQLANREAIDQETELFGKLTNLLQGFKEARLNADRREGLLADLRTLSTRNEEAKSLVKAQWAREFALIQLAFYLMVGLMVFVVPMFTTDFHEAAIKATTAALFMIGPIGTVIQAFPAIADANGALATIHRIKSQLAEATAQETSAELGSGADGEFRNVFAEAFHEITLDAVTYAYPVSDGETGFRVGPISATFRAGEISFITGGNGSGKSTLIDLLTGLKPIDAGTISVDGRVVEPQDLQAYRDHFATVLSGYHLFHVLYGIGEIPANEADSLLADLEIGDKVSIADGAFSTIELSQGQRKRLALVAALLERKPILVLDEWAADQDPYFRAVFYEKLLPRLKEQGKIVICITHDDRWFNRADRVYHMHEGRLVPRA